MANKPGRWLVTVGLGSLSILMGVVFCWNSERIAESIHLYIGAALILNGIALSFLFFWRREYYKPQSRMLRIGLLLTSAGIVVSCSHHYSQFVICIVWGIISIVKSSWEIDHLVKERSLRLRVWIQAAFSLTELVLGIILLLELTGGIRHHVLFLGISWIADGTERLLEFWDNIDV